jgi:hypothetical protein
MNNTAISDAAGDPHGARRVFFWTFGLTLLLKAWLAAAFPMTGDEAFFYQWGVYPDDGYYDHPPMVGWMLFALNSISSHPLALRFVTVLLWSVVALGLVDLARRLAPEREPEAWWMGALFLVLPFTWALNLVTTDTPLILFSFASGYCFLRARINDRPLWYVGAGAFLGLALLSKYFAGLLAIVYFVYLARSRRGWLHLLLIAACALPFAAFNFAYNAHNCWSNVMFNLINRHEGTRWGIGTVVGYLAMMVYLITPWVFVRLLRARSQLLAWGAVTVLFIVPFTLFLVLSARKTIGLHWVLAFMPFVFLFAGLVAQTGELRKYWRWTIWFSVPHGLALAAIILLPASAWQGVRLHDDIVFHKHTDQIIANLRAGLPENGKIMARAYTPASLLSYHAGEYLPVFGEGRYHARQDDMIVDFREYDGRPVRIFDRREIKAEELAPYFDTLEIGSFAVEGVTFWYADGANFNYAAFRERVLQAIADRYYQIPGFLPVYGCGFLERYQLRPR